MRAKRDMAAAFVEFCKNDTDAGNTYKIWASICMG
jgi:hypothetical protein